MTGNATVVSNYPDAVVLNDGGGDIDVHNEILLDIHGKMVKCTLQRKANLTRRGAFC